jgi:lantibiotic modifying enzyme
MATKMIPKDHPALQMALDELEKISGNQEYRNIYEMRLKAEHDMISDLHNARVEGIAEGLEKGIYALHKIGKTPEEITELLSISMEKVLVVIDRIV